MVELIVGKKGKGKTKVLLDKVNGAIKEANGSIVYLDKSTKHMYELNNKVRLIDVSVYPIKNADEFVGFVCGIISQDHDLEQIYLDSRKVRMQLERLFAEYVTESQAQYVETADIKAVLDSLKQRNIWIGLATADTVPSAKNCLKRLEVLEKFDYVGADDGVLRPKPEADMFLEFQKKFGLKPQEIAVVGDTYNDIRFARENGGVAIGVLSGVSQEADFCGEADYILNSVGELPQLLEQI